MHVLEPHELLKRKAKRHKRQRARTKVRLLALCLLVLLLGYTVLEMLLPQPALSYTLNPPATTMPKPVSLSWPGYGQSAVGIVGYGLLESHNEQKAYPIASVAKVITALVVLKAKPLDDGKNGPLITITAADEQMYEEFLSQGQSVVRVSSGEQISEYEALQALLLPSANNIAVVLTNWAFGSQSNYLNVANSFTKSLGMTNTHIADASGFSAQTTSTASDLTKLAENAMNQPVVSKIVAQPEADFPLAGRIHNINNLLGKNNVIGIKTGNTDEAGGCFMFAAKRQISPDVNVTVVGVILGGPSLSVSLRDAPNLINSTFANIGYKTIISSGQQIGVISRGKSVSVPIIASGDLKSLTWPSHPVGIEIQMDKLPAELKAKQKVGEITIRLGNYSLSSAASVAQSLQKPNFVYRLRHPGAYL